MMKRFIFGGQVSHVVLLVGWITFGCGGDSENNSLDFSEGGACVEGESTQCQCADGRTGAAQCVGGFWQACMCTGMTGPAPAGTGLCGNGIVEGAEQCDLSNLRGETCASATLNARPQGNLLCSSACTLDPAGCMAGGPGPGGSAGAPPVGAGGTPPGGGGTFGGGGTMGGRGGTFGGGGTGP